MSHDRKIKDARPTLGSLFAGIGGFERGGFRTAWQVEINERNRAVLGHRFPHAAQFADVRDCGAANLAPVDCVTAGFPCQDISTAGSRRAGPTGLAGEKSGLFFESVRIIDEIQPRWVVFENVAALLFSNGGKDFGTVLCTLAERGWMGCFRMLDARHFGSPARRRRIFLVAGHGELPPIGLLSDSRPVETVSSATEPSRFGPADKWTGYTLLATNARGRISLGSELLCAVEDGWGAMVERARSSRDSGVPIGLDEPSRIMHFAAGNAVHPGCAEFVARHLLTTFTHHQTTNTKTERHGQNGTSRQRRNRA